MSSLDKRLEALEHRPEIRRRVIIVHWPESDPDGGGWRRDGALLTEAELAELESDRGVELVRLVVRRDEAPVAGSQA